MTKLSKSYSGVDAKKLSRRAQAQWLCTAKCSLGVINKVLRICGCQVV